MWQSTCLEKNPIFQGKSLGSVVVISMIVIII